MQWLKKQTLFSALLKVTVITITLFSGGSSYAVDKNFIVKIRDGKKLVDQERTLVDLDNDQELNGKNFKIVNQENDEPVKFNDSNSNMVLKAASVYYNLNQARNYFISSPFFKDEKFQKCLNQKITVRVEETHQFSSVRHFKLNVNKDGKDFSTFFSSSLAVPGSIESSKSPFELDGITPIKDWGPEVWFMAPKPIAMDSALNQVGTMLGSRNFKNQLTESLLYSDLVTLGNDTIITRGNPNLYIDGINVVLSIGLSELIPDLFSWTLKLSHSESQIDTALIPEIVFHEYTHIVLGEIFKFKYSSALNEGYPNYFAFKISGLPELGANTDGLSKNLAPKSALNTDMYSWDQEYKKWAAQGSFAMSVLSQLDQRLSALDANQSSSTSGEEIVINSLLYLNQDSKLKPDLEKAVALSIQNSQLDRNQKMTARLTARAFFKERGM